MIQTEEGYGEILNTIILCILERGCLKCKGNINLSTNNYVICQNKLFKYRYSIYKKQYFRALKQIK